MPPLPPKPPNLWQAARGSLVDAKLVPRRLPRRSPTQPWTCRACSVRSQKRLYAVDHSTTSTKQTRDESRNDDQATTLQDGLEAAMTGTAAEEAALPSQLSHSRSRTTKRLSHLMDSLQDNLAQASQRLNELTGYTSIEALKGRVVGLEAAAAASQAAVRAARAEYATTTTQRAASQREVTTLLARKDTWTPADLERFTALYRADHANEAGVHGASARLAEAERRAEHVQARLARAILERYHEEQIWSDKIRRMSTWGTWGLMGVNVLLFLVFQLGLEPWRRRRLVSGFEDKVRVAVEQVRATTAVRGPDDEDALWPGDQDAVVASTSTATHHATEVEDVDTPNVPSTMTHDPDSRRDDTHADFSNSSSKTTWVSSPTSLPDRLRATASDLLSTRPVTLRKHDLTLLVAQSAATGAVVMAVVGALIVRRA